MKEKRYDVILWDVDGTLLNFLSSERWALMETFRFFGKEIDDETVSVYSAINDSFWKRLERQEITKEEVQRGRFEALFDVMHITDIEVAEFQKKYQRNLGSVYFYMEDSLSLCKKLKEEGFLQYIITNGVEWTQKNKLHLAGFDQIMDDIFISEVIGYHKPDVRFFDLCMEKVMQHSKWENKSFDRKRILVVGDSMTSDMKGAENAGLDSCFYAPAGEREQKAENVTYQIAHLQEIEEILWQNQRDKN